MRKDVLYESVKKFVKKRKVDLSAFFTGSLRNRKFKISCCVCFSRFVSVWPAPEVVDSVFEVCPYVAKF